MGKNKSINCVNRILKNNNKKNKTVPHTSLVEIDEHDGSDEPSEPGFTQCADNAGISSPEVFLVFCSVSQGIQWGKNP